MVGVEIGDRQARDVGEGAERLRMEAADAANSHQPQMEAFLRHRRKRLP
jgi:hypothetical protein